jgi:hypothetical protein
VSEFWAIVITFVAGACGLIAGLVVGTVVGMAAALGGSDLSVLPYLPVVFAVTGFVLCPVVALKAAGFELAEVTAGLAGLWAILLAIALGPLLQVEGPSWSPVALALAALVIARIIAGPFVPYLTHRRGAALSVPASSGSSSPIASS